MKASLSISIFVFTSVTKSSALASTSRILLGPIASGANNDADALIVFGGIIGTLMVFAFISKVLNIYKKAAAKAKDANQRLRREYCRGIYGAPHEWNGCVCKGCGLQRDKEHHWEERTCKNCGIEALTPRRDSSVVGVAYTQVDRWCQDCNRVTAFIIIPKDRYRGSSAREVCLTCDKQLLYCSKCDGKRTCYSETSYYTDNTYLRCSVCHSCVG